eukprot:833636-Prymnesium_polylepis.1
MARATCDPRALQCIEAFLHRTCQSLSTAHHALLQLEADDARDDECTSPAVREQILEAARAELERARSAPVRHACMVLKQAQGDEAGAC